MQEVQFCGLVSWFRVLDLKKNVIIVKNAIRVNSPNAILAVKRLTYLLKPSLSNQPNFTTIPYIKSKITKIELLLIDHLKLFRAGTIFRKYSADGIYSSLLLME